MLEAIVLTKRSLKPGTEILKSSGVLPVQELLEKSVPNNSNGSKHCHERDMVTGMTQEIQHQGSKITVSPQGPDFKKTCN
jgi:hypothetical protein